MVIANSNSSSTLASLDDVRKIGLELISCEKESACLRTEILLPEDDGCDDYGCDSDSCDYSAPLCENHLYLPASFDAVDIYLRSIPQLMQPADELLANAPRRFTCASSDRLLYVGQGEVGHATSRQCDVIASDKATTCHILAFRSSSSKGPLVNLAHIDGAGYESCIRSMINEHVLFHADGEEMKSLCDADPINIDVYVMGGFEDHDDSSRTISNFLMHLLVQVAAEQSEELTLTLKLCAISSMNDDGRACPIGRGLGISILTGEAFLTSVDVEVAGPAPLLRSARLWSGNGGKTLSVIHTHTSNSMVVRPFRYAPLPQLDTLLTLPDEIMINYTSTSPDVEEDDFCDSVRATLLFLKHVECERVFGAGCRQPAIFCRVDMTNQWKQSEQF